jgi:hypothetical protein
MTAGGGSGRGIDAGVEVTGYKETLRAFNTYGKEANRELREAAGVEADRLVAAITLAAGTAGPQAALVATTVRRKSDRVPAVVAGGSRRIRPNTRPKRKVSAGDVALGAEFGGGRRPATRQFPPYSGHRGYWFWPTVRAQLPEIGRRYIKALDTLARKWGTGGDPGG